MDVKPRPKSRLVDTHRAGQAVLINTSHTGNLILKHDDVARSPQNRFHMPTERTVVMDPGEKLVIVCGRDGNIITSMALDVFLRKRRKKQRRALRKRRGW